MELATFILAIAALSLACANTVLVLGASRRTKEREAERDKSLTEALKLATDVIESATPRITPVTVTPKLMSPEEARAIIDSFFGPCKCPNCEEERRIAHATQQGEEK